MVNIYLLFTIVPMRAVSDRWRFGVAPAPEGAASARSEGRGPGKGSGASCPDARLGMPSGVRQSAGSVNFNC